MGNYAALYYGTKPVLTLAPSASVIDTTWTKDSHWITLPTLSSSMQYFVGNYMVINNDANYLHIGITSTAGHTVDWGDGIIESYSSTSTGSLHAYTYSAVPAGTEYTHSNHMLIRQALVQVYVTGSGKLSSIDLNKTHPKTNYNANAKPQWLECAVHGNNLTALSFRNSTFMENCTVGTVSSSLTSGASMFNGCYSLATMSFGFAHSFTTCLQMFSNCYTLQTIPYINTISCSTFQSMFSTCQGLKTIPLLNTSNGTDFSSMFATCPNLLAIPQIDTSNATTMTSMFSQCYSLKTIPYLNTAKNRSFTSTWSGCYSLYCIPELNMSASLTNNSMCTNCYSLQSFGTCASSASTTYSGAFEACMSLRTVGPIAMDSCVTGSRLFNQAYQLKTIKGTLNTVNNKRFDNMFYQCYELEEFPSMSTTNGTSFNGMFSTCYTAKTIPSIDTSNGTDFTNMFASAQSLQAIPRLNVSASTTYTTMFSNCYSLSSGSLQNARANLTIYGKFGRQGLINMFNDLGTVATSASTVTITGNFGASDLTAADRAIASGKGWIITG